MNFRNEGTETMRACASCGAIATEATRLEEHLYELMSIPVILVNAAWRVACKGCGHETVLVPDQEGLTAATAVVRVQIPVKLNGKEIKFLRKALGYTAAALGEKLGDVVPETISRWENGASISPKSEAILRMFAAVSLSERAPAVDINYQALVHMKVNPGRTGFDLEPLRFERVKLKENRATRELWDQTTVTKEAA